MSFAQPSWSPVESTESPMILTLRLSNSGLIFAMYPSSVVQTGVKSFGCENSTAHESPIQSWKRIRPSVVSASKSGAVSPICNAIYSSFAEPGPLVAGPYVHTDTLRKSASQTAFVRPAGGAPPADVRQRHHAARAGRAGLAPTGAGAPETSVRLASRK